MAERRRLTDQHVKIHSSLPSLVRRKLSWPVVGIALVIAAVPAVTVHFLERISYQNSLNRQQVEAAQVQDQAAQQKADLKHVIDLSDKQINCLQLQSDAAKQFCKEHDAVTPL
ncbi:MAG TPA: hypothetical protein VJR27_05480 [Candidatus Saccharimonadales bacterium]|nr:hypothetical protein [Candidatus Saccharimonadales bacterium]